MIKLPIGDSIYYVDKILTIYNVEEREYFDLQGNPHEPREIDWFFGIIVLVAGEKSNYRVVGKTKEDAEHIRQSFIEIADKQ